MRNWNKIGVVGGGTMGQRITEMLAKKGLDVLLVEKSDRKLQLSIESIEINLDKQLEKWALTKAEKKSILAKIHKTDNMDELRSCHLVIETITEHLESKKEVFRQLDKCCGPDTILASNTSTLSLTELAGVTEQPNRVIGLHFLYPVANIDLIEIIRGVQTSDETYEKTYEFVSRVLGKQGILVYESPGYVTTRLMCVLINEALHTLSEGVASAEDIDAAMRMGYDFRYGPLELCDRFGLDATLAALEQLFREFGELKYRPSFLLKKMVRAGNLGVKTGQGFFKYDHDGDRL